ncbi:uncharacterized protein LOC142325394 [Lycorma delicatula]|uniref:uncharacterized protein LOC142325394 n=1 Tax=Lycorma delicatula TaxID=130591 RepID=UPI003F519983
MACYMCSVILMILFISYINANVIMQDTATKIQFPPSSVNASSISEKIADFTGSGLQKFKSGVTSFINNVSAAFNKTQDPSSVILGAACTADANCSAVIDASCDRGMCNCGPNFTVAITVADRCLRIVKLGEACEEDIQCSKGQTGAICVGSHCVCSEKYTEEEGHCVAKTKIGSSCKVKDDCAQIPFGDCSNEGICACPKPLIPSIYSNSCLIRASPAGDPPCQEDGQCQATYGDKSTCIESICTCDKGYHPYNGRCLPDLKLGNTCTQIYDCIVSKYTEEQNLRECSNSTCICKRGFAVTADEDQCVKGYGYQMQASLAWLLCIFLLPYIF